LGLIPPPDLQVFGSDVVLHSLVLKVAGPSGFFFGFCPPPPHFFSLSYPKGSIMACTPPSIFERSGTRLFRPSGLFFFPPFFSAVFFFAGERHFPAEIPRPTPQSGFLFPFPHLFQILPAGNSPLRYVTILGAVLPIISFFLRLIDTLFPGGTPILQDTANCPFFLTSQADLLLA